jgi:hypothetical protein
MPKEKESFSEQLRIRRAKEQYKKMTLQERIEFLKDEKKREVKKERYQRKEEARRQVKSWNSGRY